MDNPFDQFDGAAQPDNSISAGANPFDQFDGKSHLSPMDYASDIGKSAASGVARTAADFALNPVNFLKYKVAAPIAEGAGRLAGKAYEGLGGELSPEMAQELTYPLGEEDKDPTAMLINHIIPAAVQAGTGMNMDYQPQTTEGKITQGAIKALPMVAGDEAAIPSLIRASGIGTGGELGKQAAEGLGFGEKGQKVASLLSSLAGVGAPEALKSSGENASLVEAVNNGMATDKAHAYIVKSLLKAGESPDTIMEMLERGKEAGATVGEAAKNPELLAQQQNIAATNTPGGNTLRNFASDRVNPDSETSVPGKLQAIADPIQARMEQASDDIGKTVENAPSLAVEMPSIEKILSRDAKTTNAGAAPVIRTLDRIQTIIDSAKEQGGTFDAWHRAKQAIQSIRNEARNPTAVDQLDTATANKYYSAINDTLQNPEMLPPELGKTAEDYALHNRTYRTNLAGKTINDAIADMPKGGNEATAIGSLYRKLANNEDLMNTMPVDQQRGMQELLSSMNDIAQGGLRSHISGDAGSGISLPTSKYQVTHKAINWMANKILGRDPNAIAQVLTNPDLAELGRRLGASKGTQSFKNNITEDYLKNGNLQPPPEAPADRLPPSEPTPLLPSGGTPPLQLGILKGAESSDAWATAPNTEEMTGTHGNVRPMTNMEVNNARVRRADAANLGVTPGTRKAAREQVNPSTELGQISRHNEAVSAWDRQEQNLSNRGLTYKEIVNKIGKRPNPVGFKRGGKVDVWKK